MARTTTTTTTEGETTTTTTEAGTTTTTTTSKKVERRASKQIYVKVIHTSPFGRRGDVVQVDSEDPRAVRYLDKGLLEELSATEGKKLEKDQEERRAGQPYPGVSGEVGNY